MKTKNQTIVFIGTVLLVIGSGIREGMAIETISPVSKAVQLSPIFVSLQDGPGPVCYPGIGCGNAQSIGVWQDGPGPVCWPGMACMKGEEIGVLKGGPGPMCVPGVGGCLKS